MDAQTDVANCGSCGKACSGTCSHGHCAITIASLNDYNAVSGMTADDQYLYYGTYNQVRRIPTGGGKAVDLAMPGYVPLGDFVSLQHDASNIYFVDYGFQVNRVCSVSKSGGAVKILAEVKDLFYPLTIDTTTAYVRGANFIYSVPLSGGAAKQLAPSDGTLYFMSAISTDGVYVYWGSKGTGVVRTPVGGGATAVLVPNRDPNTFEYDSGFVYFSAQFGLERYSTQFNYNETLGGFASAAFAAENQTAYFVDTSGNTYGIAEYNIQMKSKARLVDEPQALTYFPLAINSASIFCKTSVGDIKQVSR